MTIVCLLGKSGGGKSTVERELAKLGYNRIISYTTREKRGNEQDGVEYNFVTRDEFMSLVKKGIIIEHAEYLGNLYGAPRPIGAINHVVVVESDGYKKFREIYGRQVIGVYIDTPDDVIKERHNERNDTSIEDRDARSKLDDIKFSGIADAVDIVVDGRKPVKEIVFDIIKFIRS